MPACDQTKAQGKCYKGATCKFAHGISALRAKPDCGHCIIVVCHRVLDCMLTWDLPLCSLFALPCCIGCAGVCEDLCKTKMCSDFKQYGAFSRGKEWLL